MIQKNLSDKPEKNFNWYFENTKSILFLGVCIGPNHNNWPEITVARIVFPDDNLYSVAGWRSETWSKAVAAAEFVDFVDNRLTRTSIIDDEILGV